MGNVIVTVSGKVPLPDTASPLGKSRGQAWAAWPAERAVTEACDSALCLAYLDDTDFRRETAGLSASQTAEVMRKRAAGNGQYLSDMSDLLAAEAGRLGAWLGDSAALEVQRDGYFTGRFIYENLQDIGDLIQGWKFIQSLQEDLYARKDCPPTLTDTLRKRDSHTLLLHLEKAASISDLSRADLKIRTAEPRILYVRKLPPGLASRAENRDLVVDKAGKGYLVPLSPEEIAKLPPSLHPVIVFLNAAESARAVRLSTPAQLDKQVAALVAQGGVSFRDYLAEILDARLRMLATIRQCLSDAKFHLSTEGRAELEAAYAEVLREARQSALDYLGPSDPAQGQARLAWLRLRIRILARFSAGSGDAGLLAWTRRSVAALEAKP